MFPPFLNVMCFRARSCQSPLKDVSVMLCVLYVVTVTALGVLTSETKSTIYKCTYIYSPICARTIIR
jgi:preprotein translocase subunit SecG